ncbi:MAG: hypothetical protein U1A78_37810 [Polyangia bacterium]
MEREAGLLTQVLRGPRCVLRPAWAYLGLPSALAYRRYLARSPAAQERAAALPALVAAILGHLRRAPLDVLALGVGDGVHEVSLAQHLAEQRGEPLSLCLQDLSEPLLSCAYLRAAEVLSPHAQKELWALLADLEELSLHADLLFRPERQRLVLMLGGTLGELEDELRFLRYGLARCRPGDLLALEAPLAVAGSEAAITSRQGEAANEFLDEAEEWFTAALAPHVLARPSAWALRLETQERMPGCYAWCVEAKVDTVAGPRTIEVYRRRHYDPAQLAACLRALGWEPVTAPLVGDSEDSAVHLFRRCVDEDGRGSAPPGARKARPFRQRAGQHGAARVQRHPKRR